MHKRNIIFKILSYLGISIISLLMVPALVDTLGLELYGVIGVFNSSLYYISLITISFTSTFSRNLLFSIESDKQGKPNIEYSTNMLAVSILFLLFTPIFYLNTSNIISFLSIPDKYYNESHYLLLAVYASFVISVYSGLYSSVYIIKNRLDIQSVNNFVGKAILFILVMYCVVNAESPTKIYSFSIVIAATVLLCFNYFNFRRNFKFLVFKKNDVKLISLKNNINLSGWMFVNQVGSILLLQIPIYFTAIFVGYYFLGIYNILLVIVTQIRLIGTLISSIFEPTIFKLVAQDKKSETRWVTNLASLMLGVITSVIVGVFIGSAEYFFDMWLKTYDSELIHISTFATVYLPLSVISTPFWSFLIAKKSLSVNSIATVIFGLINLIALLGIEYTIGLNIYYIIISSSVILLIKNLVYLPLYMRRFGFRTDYFYITALLSLVIIIVSFMLTKTTFRYISPSSLFMVTSCYFIVCIIIFCIILSLWRTISKDNHFKKASIYFYNMKSTN
ncbi:hypothetical protein VHA01S_032_00310 [Vibrio halioticoli NBRC 102217]|uniref:Polysaccharide biosynthesis protein C-terminal domain-containing protein n=1 Tax=Vibrio halioticoli NBRC 102217 TaxID=1219072 RepID=V5FK14_9VIBR|nr:MATE family efflux transporter [Vibrio halioticoli]GAD90081.1 hypothetical protein VHA01S_032_00310 [Vibrio halioticoli NBRC 102217]